MEPRRIYDYRSPHCQPHRTAASDPGYRSLRAFLLVKRQGAMDHLRKPRPHEAHDRERRGANPKVDGGQERCQCDHVAVALITKRKKDGLWCFLYKEGNHVHGLMYLPSS